MTNILIKGSFTEEEVSRIANLIRDIEATRPHENFEFHFAMPDVIGDLREKMDRMFPPRPGYQSRTWDRTISFERDNDGNDTAGQS